MLSLSADLTETAVDLKMINGDEAAAKHSDVPYATELMRFAEAIALRDAGDPDTAREALHQIAGDAVTVDAACVAANFQRMVRIADGTGIPLDDMVMALSADFREDMGLGEFGSAEYSKEPGFMRRLMIKAMFPLLIRRMKKTTRASAAAS